MPVGVGAVPARRGVGGVRARTRRAAAGVRAGCVLVRGLVRVLRIGAGCVRVRGRIRVLGVGAGCVRVG